MKYNDDKIELKNIREEFQFRSFAALIMLIVTFIVFQIHKWSIENIHKRLKAVESQLDKSRPIIETKNNEI